MPYANPIVAGTALAIPAIHSPNYVPGVQGWAIFRDGSSEFASGTFRGPVVVIDPTTGAILASIGATGNGSFQNLQANDLILGGQSVLSAITQRAKGVVGMFSTTSDLGLTGTTSVFKDMLWTSFTVDPTRLYRLALSSTDVINQNLSNTQSCFNKLIVQQAGGFTKSVINNELNGVGSRGQILQLETIWAGSDTVAGPATLKWQSAGDGSSGFLVDNRQTDRPLVIWIEDVGPLVSQTGGIGTPTGGAVYTVKYVATASRSYDGSGNFIGSPDGDNNMYGGSSNSRSFGTEKAIWLFNGNRIRNDLNGASGISGTMFAYAFRCDSTGGDLDTSWLTNSTLPTTDPGVGNNRNQINNIWSIPGWGSKSLNSNDIFELTSNGANALRWTDAAITQDPTGWRGFGFDPTLRPYLQITYTSNTPPQLPPNIVLRPFKIVTPMQQLPPATFARIRGKH